MVEGGIEAVRGWPIQAILPSALTIKAVGMPVCLAACIHWRSVLPSASQAMV